MLTLLDDAQRDKTAVSTQAGFLGKKTQTSSGWLLPQENQTLLSKGCSSRRLLRGSLRANHHSSSAATGAARRLCRHRSWAHTCNKHSAFIKISTGLFITQVLGVFFKALREELCSHRRVGLFTELLLMRKRKSQTKRATSSITTAPGMLEKTKKQTPQTWMIKWKIISNCTR